MAAERLADPVDKQRSIASAFGIYGVTGFGRPHCDCEPRGRR